MLRRARALAMVVLLAIAALGAGDATGRVQLGSGSPEGRSPSNDAVVEHDDLFAEVAALAPGFGGLFLDKDGILNVYLLDPAAEGAATAAISAVFGPERFPLGEVRVLQGKYDFSQLWEWRHALRRDVLGLPGVTSLDIDELKNRLRVGVERAEVEPEVEKQLARLGIPREAVNIEVEPPVELAIAVQNHSQPLQLGLGGREDTRVIRETSLETESKSLVTLAE
jgi:hypothetical protein